MRRRTSDEKRIAAALILVTLAIVGYVAGKGRSTAAPGESTREASNAATTLNYSSSSHWRPASGAPPVPGLTIAQPLVLAPAGDAARAGLIVGQMLDSEFGPLPPQLLAHLGAVPKAEVVDLSGTQAYRYAGLADPGSDLTLTLYTIPVSASSTMAMVCYVATGSASYRPACEHLATTLALAAGSPPTAVRAEGILTPDAGYGRKVSAAAARVDSLLSTLRPALHGRASAHAAQGVAERLADGLGSVAGSLSAIRPPAAARRANATLSLAIRQASAAYAALSSAAGAGDTASYATARTGVYTAETGVSTALRNFTLLGYQ